MTFAHNRSRRSLVHLRLYRVFASLSLLLVSAVPKQYQHKTSCIILQPNIAQQHILHFEDLEAKSVAAMEARCQDVFLGPMERLNDDVNEVMPTQLRSLIDQQHLQESTNAPAKTGGHPAQGQQGVAQIQEKGYVSYVSSENSEAGDSGVHAPAQRNVQRTEAWRDGVLQAPLEPTSLAGIMPLGGMRNANSRVSEPEGRQPAPFTKKWPNDCDPYYDIRVEALRCAIEFNRGLDGSSLDYEFFPLEDMINPYGEMTNLGRSVLEPWRSGPEPKWDNWLVDGCWEGDDPGQ